MWEIISSLTWDDVNQYLIDQVLHNQFASAAGLAGLAALIWNYTRRYPEWLWTRIRRKIVYTVNIYETTVFFGYFETWLRKTHKNAYRNVEARSYWTNGVEGLRYFQFQDVLFIWKGFCLITVYKNREKLENASNLETVFMNSYTVSGFFAKKAILKIMQEAFDMEEKRRKEEKDPRIKIYTNDAHGWVSNRGIIPKPLANIVVEGKEKLLEDVDNFLKSKEWYRKRNISYKRGYMFEGDPGNGKTTLALSLAKYIRRDVYMLTPNRMTDDDDLMGLFRNLNPKSVLLIEDIDSIYGIDREAESEEVRFSFSTFLNCLDGALSKEDIIVIFTTNFPEKLDAALIREGRIDYRMRVDNPTQAQVEEYLSIFYEREMKTLDYDGKLPISMVQVQNICLKNKDNPEGALQDLLKKINSL